MAIKQQRDTISSPLCRQKLKSEAQKVGEDVGEEEPSCVAGENIN